MLLGISSSTDKAPGFQRSVLLNNSKWSSTTSCIPSCNQNITIFLKTIHGFSPALHRNSSSGKQYTPPNKFPNPVKITDTGCIQTRFIFTCLLFKDTGFPPFELSYLKKLLIQILVNLILESGLVTLQSLFISYDMLYIIPYCHCSALFHLSLALFEYKIIFSYYWNLFLQGY